MYLEIISSLLRHRGDDLGPKTPRFAICISICMVPKGSKVSQTDEKMNFI